MPYIAVAVFIPLIVWLIPFMRSRLLFLLAPAIVGYFCFILELKRSLFSGFLLLLWWSFLLTVSVLYFSFRHYQLMQNVIFRAKEYTDSMLHWLRTGQLPEGSGFRVVVTHLEQAALYCLPALLTGNILSILFGTALLNYMNAYVAFLSLNSEHPIKTALLGWNPWSIIRVVSFLWLGVVLSVPFLSYFLTNLPDFRLIYLLPGFLGLVVDITVKLLLSEPWRKRINSHLSPFTL